MRFVSDDQFALVMNADGIMIRIVQVGEFTPARFTILGWEVSAIETLVPQMSATGVTFEQYGLPGQDTTGIWNAPGGNVLSLSQHPA